MKRKIIIGLITLSLIAVVSTVVYKINASNENKKMVTGYDTEISTVYTQFLGSKEDSDKINNIEELSKDYETYKNSDTGLDIESNFTTKIKSMKDYFIKKNDKVIADNTLEDIENNEDKAKIMNSTTNLSNILATISNEANAVYTEEQVNKYKDSIGKLVASYDARVEAIDKVMIEAKKVAEAKAKAEADKKAKEIADAKIAADKKAKEIANAKVTTANKISNTKTPVVKAPVATTPKTTTSSHGRILEYRWATDANGNKVPDSTIELYEDGYRRGPDGRWYSPDLF
ncbi:hypothetical protein [Clostridium sp.]|uniref:hypothetical protein n=1 Tax=Clostridium sp. TaxID=1506 RepID=UPI001A4B47FB|nr:hypothetical protein [Clostridium sp.]MBK5241121.1 hypothetical protein [Clostridium sp.]